MDETESQEVVVVVVVVVEQGEGDAVLDVGRRGTRRSSTSACFCFVCLSVCPSVCLVGCFFPYQCGRTCLKKQKICSVQKKIRLI